MAKKKKDQEKSPDVASVTLTNNLVADAPVYEQRGLEAMVNEKTRHGTVNAFSGFEYVRYEWRTVPAGFEAQAEAHPYLDIRPHMVQVGGGAEVVDAADEGEAAETEPVTDETGSDVTSPGDVGAGENVGTDEG